MRAKHLGHLAATALIAVTFATACGDDDDDDLDVDIDTPLDTGVVDPLVTEPMTTGT